MNKVQICDCPIPNCGCAGGMHTYAPYYKALLKVLQPKRVFEWGPGPNTVMALDAGAYVTSVESDKQWIPNGSNNKFICHLVPVEHHAYPHLWGEDYANIFFVDGRRRSQCIENIYRNCHDRAVVCLHDAQRKRYQESLNAFPHVRHITHGFAIASKWVNFNHLCKMVLKEADNG